MATVALSNEPKTGKPRVLNSNLQSVAVTYSVDLQDIDGSLILAGKINQVSISAMVNPSDSAELKAAKQVWANAILIAFETYVVAAGLE